MSVSLRLPRFGKREAIASEAGASFEKNDAAAVYGKFQDAQHTTWREWIAAPLAWLRPVGIVCVCSLVGNAWQFASYQSLVTKVTSVAPVVVVVDPTKSKVLQTINLDPAQFRVDQEAEKKMVRQFIENAFSITTDAHRGRQQKELARDSVVDQSPALTKMDGWWADPAHDPILAGVNGTTDVVNVSVTPLLGDHHWSIQWTLQPYDLDGTPKATTSYRGELSLMVIMPRTQDEANKWFPYTFVRDIKFGVN